MKPKPAAIIGAIIGCAALLATLAYLTMKDHSSHPHEHDEHDDHPREEAVRLSEAELKEFGIELAVAAPGTLVERLSLAGEIVPNADRLAHVVPRVGGIVKEVFATVGIEVKAGQVMAVLDSRELADATVAYLAARERAKLTEANLNRAEDLAKKNIYTEKDLLEARRSHAEAGIELRSSHQKLLTLGVSQERLANLPEQPNLSYTRYEITAPFDGTVIEKHITLGEAVKDDAVVFTVADLTTVWADLSVHPKDLPRVWAGQTASILTGKGVPDSEGKVSFVAPVVDEATRTARARVELANPDGQLRPGLFVTGHIVVGEAAVPLLLPRTAIQLLEEHPVVFVQTETGFAPRQVHAGRGDETHVEILDGIDAGMTYAARGAFAIKAQLTKAGFGHGHQH